MKIISIGMNDHAKFDSLVKHTPAFVKFYMDGCIHCINMAHEWEKMAKYLRNKHGDSVDINIIEVNAGALPAMSSRVSEGIQSFPTLLEVKPNGERGEQYNGERSADKMSEWFENTFRKYKFSSNTERKQPRRRRSTKRKRKQRRKYRRRRTRSKSASNLGGVSSKKSKRKTKRRRCCKKRCTKTL
jgi:hypothetical protein